MAGKKKPQQKVAACSRWEWTEDEVRLLLGAWRERGYPLKEVKDSHKEIASTVSKFLKVKQCKAKLLSLRKAAYDLNNTDEYTLMKEFGWIAFRDKNKNAVGDEDREENAVGGDEEGAIIRQIDEAKGVVVTAAESENGSFKSSEEEEEKKTEEEEEKKTEEEEGDFSGNNKNKTEDSPGNYKNKKAGAAADEKMYNLMMKWMKEQAEREEAKYQL